MIAQAIHYVDIYDSNQCNANYFSDLGVSDIPAQDIDNDFDNMMPATAKSKSLHFRKC